MKWSGFDNFEVKRDEIKNLDPEKIQQEIIDKLWGIKLITNIYHDYNNIVFESTSFDGDDKIKNHVEFHIFCISLNIVEWCFTLILWEDYLETSKHHKKNIFYLDFGMRRQKKWVCCKTNL